MGKTFRKNDLYKKSKNSKDFKKFKQSNKFKNWEVKPSYKPEKQLDLIEEDGE